MQPQLTHKHAPPVQHRGFVSAPGVESSRRGVGHAMYDLAARLFPIHRSITGNGVRQTFGQLRELLPDLNVVEVPSGTPAFDWVVPVEWNVRDAYISDVEGRKVVDLAQSGLHVMGYSEPVDRWLSLAELDQHLYSLPDQPDAIPYVTSYYERRWGFCLTHSARLGFKGDRFRAVIESTLAPGSLTYGELIIRGRQEDEVLLSTYVCHPCLANDNLSGVCLTAYLAKWLLELDRRYTYRILFVPETIGALVYLSRHHEEMRTKTRAGFVITCVGNEDLFSFVPSRLGGTLADRVALHVLHHYAPHFKSYSFLDRGSDERQYCSPGVDLPVVSVMRSKYREYPEYHTSKDDLSLISPSGLTGSFNILRRCIEAIESNVVYQSTTLGEPQLGRRGLFPTTSVLGSASVARELLNVLQYSDGNHSLIDIAETIGTPIDRCDVIARQLHREGLLELCAQRC